MKKALLTFATALLCTFSFAQTIQKGSLIGIHILTPTLKEGVTMQDYTAFQISKVIPEIEQAFQGVKGYIVKSVRGQDSSSVGVIYIFNNEADRNKYWKSDGTPTEAGQAAIDKVNAKLGKEIEKYETASNAPNKYNDWVIQ